MKRGNTLLVLLQRIDAGSLFTQPLLEAFQDVTDLFRHALDGAPSFESIYLAPSLPTDDLRRQPRIDWARTEQLLGGDEWWEGPRRRTPRVDQARILPKVRALVHASSNESLVVVINALITPPSGWSYALWDVVTDRDGVVSLPPMSPSYWGLGEDGDRMSRVRLIRSRAHAATCAVVGRQLGLEPCANPGCYLYEDVMEVAQLDEMHGLGEEHRLRAAVPVVYETAVAAHPSESPHDKEEAL